VNDLADKSVGSLVAQLTVQMVAELTEQCLADDARTQASLEEDSSLRS
jgi:hypothetical protein